MDKIFIKDLVARGIIGINDWEREKPQEILINITVFTDTRPAADSDDLTDCVDYRALAKKVPALRGDGSPFHGRGAGKRSGGHLLE